MIGHTTDGIGSGVGIGSARSVPIQCKSKNGIGSGVGSSTESKSEGSEEFLLRLVYTRDGSDGSGVVSGVGIGRKF